MHTHTHITHTHIRCITHILTHPYFINCAEKKKKNLFYFLFFLLIRNFQLLPFLWHSRTLSSPIDQKYHLGLISKVFGNWYTAVYSDFRNYKYLCLDPLFSTVNIKFNWYERGSYWQSNITPKNISLEYYRGSWRNKRV